MSTPSLQSTASEHDDARKLVEAELSGGGLSAQLRVVKELLRRRTLTHAQRESLERYREALLMDIATVQRALKVEQEAALSQLLNARGKDLGGLSF